MSELGGLLLLAAGLGVLSGTGALVACCLRLRSPLEFVLAAYVVAWAWVVAIALALSPFELVRRAWLLAVLALGLLASVLLWLRLGRPHPPAFGPGLESVRRALRLPVVAVLAGVVALGTLYGMALAFLVPANEGDALAYHLARAAFWKQEQAVGYVSNAVDLRLNVSPPNAEIGQLATMLLAGNDRYVALPQLLAYASLVLCVAALARRLGLAPREAVFGALVFATLPIVAAQASGALNDLVMASFLAVAALFALTPGRAPVALAAVVLGLALGTKFTAVLALPALALVVGLGRPRADWPKLVLAGVAGSALGAAWYVLNLAETGDLDGGLASDAEQRVALSVPTVVINAVRFGLDLVDMSGFATPYLVLLVPAAVLSGILALTPRRQGVRAVAVASACALTLSPLALPSLASAGESATIRAWSALGRPDTPPFERGWGLNNAADSTDSWFGPVGLALLLAGTVVVAVLWRRGRLPALAVALVTAPWVLLATLAVTIVWDPWRGRFLIFGVALAASTWGVLLRSRTVAATTATVGVLTLALSLANAQGKPSGLWELWSPGDDVPSFFRHGSVWGDDRSSVLVRLRPAEGEEAVYEHLEAEVPADARIAIAARENEYLLPYFGADLSRHVSLVRAGDVAPIEAQWVVESPGSRARRCQGAWRTTLELEAGWHVARRVGPDACAT